MRHTNRLARAWLVLLVAVAGCAWAGHRSSPWEWGPSLRLAPGFVIGNAGMTVHPAGSVTYLNWDGGYDLLWELGGQVRKPLSPSGFWVGGEAALGRFTVHVDDANFDGGGTGGWSLNALAGMPVGQSKWGINLYAGAGISHYGGNGTNVRVGVDLQPWFLKK